MMKKFLLLTLCGIGAAVHAQNFDAYKFYDFSESTWQDCYGDEYPAIGDFYHVSSNGRFAVGCDDNIGTGCCFFWDAADPEGISFINEADINRYTLRDVSNSGLMVGSFEIRDEEDPESPVVVYPGIYTPEDGWKALPVPEDYSEYYAVNTDFLNDARAISADGSVIAGHFYVTRGYKDTPFGLLERVVHAPALWKRNAEGEYELTMLDQIYKNSKLYDNGELKTVEDSVNFTTFMVYDISDDGTLICGMNEAGSGGFNPVIIRDGQLIQLFECGNEAEYDDDGNLIAEVNFNGGICGTIDAHNNVYGYYQTATLENKYFMYTPDDEMVFLDDFILCGDAFGNKYKQSNGSLPYTRACSDDGKVLVGGVVISLGYGVGEAPALLLADDYQVGVQGVNPDAVEVDIDIKGQHLFVNGRYSMATLYDAAGHQVARGGQGYVFALSNMPAGTYIVRVVTAEGEKSFKFVR